MRLVVHTHAVLLLLLIGTNHNSWVLCPLLQFVLSKDVPLVDQLLAAATDGDDKKVLALIKQLQKDNPTAKPARSELVSGTWRLVWSQQSENASPLQKWGTQQSRNFQVSLCGRAWAERAAAADEAQSVSCNTSMACGWQHADQPLLPVLAFMACRLQAKQQSTMQCILRPAPKALGLLLQVIDAEEGTLENVVDLGAVQIRAQATCEADGDDRTDVAINSGTFSVGPLKLPLPVKGTGYVDWLYLDEQLRITKGSKGSLFVHVREPDGMDG